MNDYLLDFVQDWRVIVLEKPHMASDGRLAYTRSDEHGQQDRQTVTTAGKYLRRHCPRMPDHVLRDIVDRFTPDRMEVTHDMGRMLHAIMNGPRSCMDGRNFPNESEHPYNVYSPAYGWGMALRIDGTGQIVGRCLVLDNADGKCFVRSYRASGEGYSDADYGLESYLKEQDFEKRSAWPYGTKLSAIPAGRWGDIYLMAYVDGNHEFADLINNEYFVITDDGEYRIQNTAGRTEPEIDRCPHCDSRIDSEDDLIHTGPHGDDGTYCLNCVDDHNVLVTGRHGVEYYVSDSNIVTVDDRHYDADYLEDNDIVYSDWDNEYYHRDDCVCLYDGEYCLEEDAVLLPNDEYAHPDDDNVVSLDVPTGNGAEYALTDDTWEDDDGNTYHNSLTPEEVKSANLAAA
jgi:hypothetical protein